MNTTSKAFLACIAAIDLLLVAFGTLAARYGFPSLGIRADSAFLMFATAAVGIITFFGLLLFLSRTNAAPLDDQCLRISITVAVVTVYLIIVGESVFWTTTLEMAKITDTVWTSFSSIVGIVVAFFFGTSAYMEVKKRDGSKGTS